MTELLKFIHFIAFATAFGGGVTNIVIGRHSMGANDPAKAALSSLQRFFARTSAISLLILWLTGIALVYSVYGGWMGLGIAFWLKIAVVVVLSINMGAAQHLMSRARKQGSPPPKHLKIMGLAGPVLVLVITLLASIAFTY